MIVTALAACIGTLLMAPRVRLPVALAPGMDSNIVFAQIVVLRMGLSYRTALAMVLIGGILFLVLPATRLRARMVDGFPDGIRVGMQCGLGLFIALIGLRDDAVLVLYIFLSRAVHESRRLTLPRRSLALSGWSRVDAAPQEALRRKVMRTHPPRGFWSRFTGLCIAQACGALNDNLVKTALLSLAIFRMHSSGASLIAVVSILFILPYAALSATAGLLADRFRKSTVARAAKLTELALMSAAAFGFVTGDVPLLMAVIGGLGIQAAVFSPVKYGLLPEILSIDELVRGNGYVEASTFVAILLGTILGGALVVAPDGTVIVAALGLALACVGAASAFAIPRTKAAAPGLTIGWNLWRDTADIVRSAHADRTIWRCILGVSWFWMVGAILTNELPLVVRDVLHADSPVQSLLLGAFSVGVGVGSVGCSRLLRGRPSTSLVGWSLAGIALFCGCFSLTIGFAKPVSGILGVLTRGDGLLMVSALLGVAACGGLFSVPLFALMQSRSRHDHHARVIAASNIVNALFIANGSVFTAATSWLGLPVAAVIGLTAALNLAALGAAVAMSPRRFIRNTLRLYFRVFHRARIQGLEHVLAAGPRAVVIANHLSYIDGIFIGTFLPGNPIFALSITEARKFWFLRSIVDVLPVGSANAMAVKTMIETIRSGRHLVIFPEGRITVTGAVMKIYDGAGLIADRADAPILPIRLDGLQFHKLSRMQGRLRLRWFPAIAMTALPARKLGVASGIAGVGRRRALTHDISRIMTEAAFTASIRDQTIFSALLDARARFDLRRPVVADLAPQDDGSVLATELGYGRLILGAIVLGRALAAITEPGEAVGVMLPNAAGAAVTFFALQSIGRVSAMMNFTSGMANLTAACRMAPLRTVLTSRRFIDKAKLQPQIAAISQVAQVVYLEDVRGALTLGDKLGGKLAALRPRRMSGAAADPDAPAVILFTSGSEGAPKGVALSHRNLVSNCHQVTAMVDISPADRLFNALPMFHSFGLTGGLLLPLLNGIRVFLYPSPLHYRLVPELVYAEQSTIMFGTDSFLSGYARAADHADFQSLRYIFAGAEKLRPETRDTYMRAFSKPIFEGYGVTETAPVLALNTYREARASTVGQLVPGLEFELVPVAGIDHGGTLRVRGPNVMRGYLGADRPGVIEAPKKGWHDTGDIVTIDDEGYVTIVGRVRRFAKIAGEMVSMTAAESLVASLWPEHQHAVVAAPDARKGERLLLVTTHAGAAIRDLQRHAQLRGATELMIPRAVLFRADIPLLGTGKVDYPAVQHWIGSSDAAAISETEAELEATDS